MKIKASANNHNNEATRNAKPNINQIYVETTFDLI